MVETIYIHKVVKQLEKYFIRKNNYRLSGDNYDLILFVPTDKYSSEIKFSLVISAQIFNHLRQKEVIRELFSDLKNVLEFEEYNSITRLNIIHTDDPFVKNLKFAFGFREEFIEINDVLIGGVNIEFAYLAKSLVLDRLIADRALILEVINPDGMIEQINAGILRIEQNFDVVYYTGKGLREIWKHEMTAEEKDKAKYLKGRPEHYLIENHFISKKNLDNIIKVM